MSAPDEESEKAELLGVTLVASLRGHRGVVGPVAWSPDDRFLASASSGEILLWNNVTWQPIRRLRAIGSVYAIAFDSQARHLATIDDGGRRVRDLSFKPEELADHRSRPQRESLPSTDEFFEEPGYLDDAVAPLDPDGPPARVFGLAWHPTQTVYATGGDAGAVALWDPAGSEYTVEPPDGRLILARDSSRSLPMPDHTNTLYAIAFDRRARWMATSGEDAHIAIWDLERGGKFHRLLLGHTSAVNSVAFHPSADLLCSGSADKTIRLWDVRTGQPLRTLEGHTGPVSVVEFVADGRVLASKAGDATIRLWRSDTGEFLGTIPHKTSTYWYSSLAFHPTRPLLATVEADGDINRVDGVAYRDVHIWKLDVDKMLARLPSRAVSYTSAKIVLVGDSGVGKTGLGWRLARGDFQDHPSTHGQQFWILNQLSGHRADGAHCEAVLWDLAGQPDYRLIHALFLDDADVALLLFDPTDRSDPLHGVDYWLKQLKQSDQACAPDGPSAPHAGTCPRLLVAARIDRGDSTLTSAETRAFCVREGIADYASTSAKRGDGITDLVQKISQLIHWNQKSATVTTETFKRIKDHVLRLKQSGDERSAIVDPEELRRDLERRTPNWQFDDAEMMTAVGHLENHGYAKILRTSRGEKCVLLAPDLLNNLAASLVLEARRNPKGLGALEEKRLLAGEYQLRELDQLSKDDRATLVDSAVLLFLNHNICFRETDPLSTASYLVFPELLNLKRPTREDDEAVLDAASYVASGAVENVYASLVVLLGYTHTFTRAEQWRNQARYIVGQRSVCGFRLDSEKDGELEFTLYFGCDVVPQVRTLFQSLFESFLARRNLTVFRFDPIECTNCSARLERIVVRTKLKEGKLTAFCSDCGTKLTLPKPDGPISLTREEKAQVDAQRRMADRRTRFEQAAFQVQAYMTARAGKVPECFISYAWGDESHEHWVERNLATDLQKAGVTVVLDRWENAKIGGSIARFVERLHRCDRVVVVGTPIYKMKLENKHTDRGHVAAAEADLISHRMLGTESDKETVLPILLAGEEKESLPPLLQRRVYADFRKEEAYFVTIFDLILSIYDIPHRDPAVIDLRQSLRSAR